MRDFNARWERFVKPRWNLPTYEMLSFATPCITIIKKKNDFAKKCVFHFQVSQTTVKFFLKHEAKSIIRDLFHV